MPVTEREFSLKNKGQEPKNERVFVFDSSDESSETSSSEESDGDDVDDDDDDDDFDKKEDIDIINIDTQAKSFDLLSLNNPRYNVPRFDSSYLKPNSRFTGIQQSGKAKYNINVELKTVDLANSLVLGFLQINGLTEQYPEITTCFRGEIISNPLHDEHLMKKYSFITENKDWESNFRNDLDHWKKLTNFYNLTDDQFLEKLCMINNGTRDHGLVYMRWKEEFLLPDARVRQIKGASFEGFYYIVLNIGNLHKINLPVGSINGLYYHKSSEKFQSLSLSHVEDHGANPCFQFL